jgi:hypothetical protein
MGRGSLVQRPTNQANHRHLKCIDFLPPEFPLLVNHENHGRTFLILRLPPWRAYYFLPTWPAGGSAFNFKKWGHWPVDYALFFPVNYGCEVRDAGC